MGVVRREGDWRLEKREDGVYEITYKQDPEVTILTPECGRQAANEWGMEPTHLREVGSYQEAEGLFEEYANEPRQDAAPPSAQRDVFDVDSPSTILTGPDEDVEQQIEGNLPPVAIAIVLLGIGGLLLWTAGLDPSDTVTKIGLGAAAIGAGIFAVAGVIYRVRGWNPMIDFLFGNPDEAAESTNDDEPEKTPPLLDRKKQDLILNRAERECERCGDEHPTFRVHHITPRAEGGSNTPENLLVLCPNCHDLADDSINRTRQRMIAEEQNETWDYDW